MTISEELDLMVDAINKVPGDKGYWMVRTQSGTLYDIFRANGLAALGHTEVPISLLNALRKEFPEDGDTDKIYGAIRKQVRLFYEGYNRDNPEDPVSNRRIGLISSQIFKFAFEIKKGDTIIIPSYNSDHVTFGVVTEDYLSPLSTIEEKTFEDSVTLSKRVRWIKDISRDNLDPYMHKMFSAHQALNDVKGYAEIIERSLKDLFIINNEAHIIINVQTTDDIPAVDLFGLGYGILRLVDDFAAQYNLDVSSKDLQVSINLNSPGKIDLKSRIKKTTLLSGMILAVFGGGYESKDGSSLTSPGVPGLIKAISDFRDAEQGRAMKQQMFETYKDSLDVKTPEDMVLLMKQFSDNKDIAK